MSNETTQTAVEWYIERLLDLDYQFSKELISLDVYSTTKVYLQEKAKEMEKEQMIKTTLFWSHSQVRREQVVEYINETYGGNK